jgi:putative membrane-bound dehydrogenase-like protein
LAVSAGAADPKPGMPPTGPLSPKEELATFKVPKGFHVELVASEPDVVDPVAIAFDEDGRLFVAEMRGYPNGGVATGTITSGTIKLLTEPDDKGVYRKSTLFASGLRLPSSVMPWKGGLMVAVAPDILYFDEKDGKGVNKRVLYTGFDLDNSEQLINGLQWGLDNWVYGCTGSKGGTITSGEKKDMPAVRLGGRGVRFHPEAPGSLEPMSGGGQYGLAADDGQHWFVNTNSQHLRHIVLPDQYLRRNPFLTVKAVTLDIPDGKDGHGAVCKVNRISPFEAWRVERTKMRVEGTVPGPTEGGHYGGYITSSCSPAIYTADLFPAAYRGNSFICEPANNLVHRDLLEPKGATFTAIRADADCEFLASTDIWFRPVFLTIGPDGAIYVADFYREVIETPLSLPDSIKKKVNIESRGRGRIWRVVPDGFKQPPQPKLREAASGTLVKHLASPNSWWRLTAQRLLVERQDKTVVPALKKMALETDAAVGRIHAMWTLHGLGSLEDGLVEAALKDKSPLVREQALRLAEERLARSGEIRTAVIKLADDAHAHVRFQLALSLGEADTPETSAALAKLLHKEGADPWFQTAILSSAGKNAPGMLDSLAGDKEFLKKITPAEQRLLARLASLAAARGADADLARVLKLLNEDKEAAGAWQVAILEGLGEGLKNSGRPLGKLWDQPPASLKEAVDRARPFFDRAAATVKDEKRPESERIAAVRLLGYGPFTAAGTPLQGLLAPSNPGELQLAAVRALSFQDSPKVPEILLSQWGSYGPALRREVLEALFARTDRLKQLLDAVEAKKVLAAQIEPARIDQLRKHPNAELRKRAVALLGTAVAPDRQKVIDAYKSALELKADTAQGKIVFKRVCTTCHRLENEGKEVGPDLLSALRTKTRDALLIDILDPSREVDPRYINYVVSTKDGRILTGMIAVEAPTSITLRRAEKAEDTILRTQIDEIQATAKSLMPDELEKQLTKQDLADVIAYLLSVVAPPGK